MRKSSYNGTRFIQRVRRKGVTASLWQRLPNPVFAAEAGFSEGLTVIMDDLHQALKDVLEYCQGSSAQMVDAVLDAANTLAENLERRTPYDHKRMNDPPLHAADAWTVRLKTNNDDQVVFSVASPKHYMIFLEEKGGILTKYGDAASPYFIQDSLNEFILDIS